MEELPVITVMIGFGRVHKTLKQAVDWVHEQDEYKNKTSKFRILADRSVDVD